MGCTTAKKNEKENRVEQLRRFQVSFSNNHLRKSKENEEIVKSIENQLKSNSTRKMQNSQRQENTYINSFQPGLKIQKTFKESRTQNKPIVITNPINSNYTNSASTNNNPEIFQQANIQKQNLHKSESVHIQQVSQQNGQANTASHEQLGSILGLKQIPDGCSWCIGYKQNQQE